jgi:hypothetical protein
VTGAPLDWLLAEFARETPGVMLHTGRRCDIGIVGYEMTMLASRVGRVLTPAARADIGGRTQ